MTVEEALIILDAVLKQEHLNDVQELVFCQAWEGQTYREIASGNDYEAEYIKLVGFQLWQLLSRSLGEKVTKSNIHSVLKRYSRRIYAGETRSLSDIAPNPKAAVGVINNQNQDWGEAIDVSVFYGRTTELLQLEQWIVQERCRLVAILGMGGMGKTALSIKLAEQVQAHFEYVIWRSLLSAPLILDLLTDLLQFLSKGRETNKPETLDGRISRLMHYLRQHRCLLVLDNEPLQLGFCLRTWVLIVLLLYSFIFRFFFQILRIASTAKPPVCPSIPLSFSTAIVAPGFIHFFPYPG
jgi:hypothetical protein